MTTRDELVEFLETLGVRTPGDPDPELYTDPWFRIPFGSRRVPIFKHGEALKQSLMIHDVHHVLTGYGTDFLGEVELAGWELGSGGCAAHRFMWFDRVGVAFVALFTGPRAFARAFREGRASRNLYRDDLEALLGLDVEDLRRRIHLPAPLG
jgi:hypothetical protein